MWFKKVKKEVSGITLGEWIMSHIEDRKYLKLYTGKDGIFKLLDTFYSVKDISYGIAEKYKNNSVSVIEIVDSNNQHDRTFVFIEE